MEGQLNISKESKNGVTLLHMKGRLDAISSPPTERQVMDLIAAGSSKMGFDFADLEYLSSAGMRLILATTKKLKAQNGKLVLYGVPSPVMDVLKMSGFDHVIDIVTGEDDALKRL